MIPQAETIHPSNGEMEKLWYIHKTEYSSTIKNEYGYLCIHGGQCTVAKPVKRASGLLYCDYIYMTYWVKLQKETDQFAASC